MAEYYSPDFEEDDPPGPVQAAQRRAKAELLLRVANVIRLSRRKDGRPLLDIQVVGRVRGVTLADVRYVRSWLERQGVLPEELGEQGEGECPAM